MSETSLEKLGLETQPCLGYDGGARSLSTIRVGGVTFYIYPADHMPPHVHGEYGSAEVVVDLRSDMSVAIATRHDAVRPANAKRSDVKNILMVAQAHFEVLLAAWEQMHP